MLHSTLTIRPIIKIEGRSLFHATNQLKLASNRVLKNLKRVFQDSEKPEKSQNQVNVMRSVLLGQFCHKPFIVLYLHLV